MVDFVHEGLFKSRPRQRSSALERKKQVALEQKLFMCPSRKLTSECINLTATVIKLAETDVEISPKPPAQKTVAK